MNRFDAIIDPVDSQLLLSSSDVSIEGEVLALAFFMNVPIVTAKIGDEPAKMFFDTGAQISYFQGDSLAGFPPAGRMVDFYPGLGEFSTDTVSAPVQLGRFRYELRCGRLPPLLAVTLSLAGVQGILGNEFIWKQRVGYFPRRNRLVLS